MQEETKKKFKLVDQEKDLKLYMFTAQRGPHISIPLNEKFHMIMAYSKDDALNEVKKFYPPGITMFMERYNIDIKKIIDTLNLDKPQEIVVETVPPPTREKTIRDYIYGMMLLADEYIKDVTDRKVVKDIIKKIKIDDPAS